MSRTLLSLAGLTLMSSLSVSQASVVINIGAANISDHTGAPLPANTLIQLVNLGADGIFNSISLLDGDVSSLGQWVSGDDTLLNVAFRAVVGASTQNGDFPTAARFDLEFQTDTTPGFLTRAFQFEIADLPAGTKLGIRWFPGLLASNFSSITLQDGQRYGEFTRQANPVNFGTLWVAPGDGANVSLDPLVTQSFGGSEPNSAGMALNIIPEPATIGLSLLAATGLTLLRRRRA